MIAQKHLDLVPSENKEKPKFIDWLEVSTTAVDTVYTLANEMYDYFDVDTAIGDQLDIIGEYVGIERLLNFQPLYGPAVMTDDVYRSVIKSKISRNAWNGTNEDFYRLWEMALPGLPVIYTDNQDMSISVVALTDPDDYTIELVQNGYYQLKPQGVLFNFAAVPIIFAYDADSLDPLIYSGYDEGYYL